MTQNFRLLDDARAASVHDLFEEANKRQHSPSLPMSETLHSDLTEIESREGVSETERDQLSKCRIGQGLLRADVIKLWSVATANGRRKTKDQGA